MSEEFRSPWMDWEPRSKRAENGTDNADSGVGLHSELDDSGKRTVSAVSAQKPKSVPLVSVSAVSTLTYTPQDFCANHVNVAEYNDETFQGATERIEPTKSENQNTSAAFCTDNADSELLDGHKVAQILYQTDRMVMFLDNEGKIWRYLFSWGRSWPVKIVTKDRPLVPKPLGIERRSGECFVCHGPEEWRSLPGGDWQCLACSPPDSPERELRLVKGERE